MQPFHRRRKRAAGFWRCAAQFAQGPSAQLRVRVDASQGSEALSLHVARALDTLSHLRAAVAGGCAGQFGGLERVRLDVHVEPVEDGTRDAAAVPVLRGDAALATGLAFESARA